MRACLGDVGPAVAGGAVGSYQSQLLVRLPALLVDVWPQLVVPALAKLLADAPGKVGQKLAPAACAMLLHQPADTVLMSGYWASGASIPLPVNDRCAACVGCSPGNGWDFFSEKSKKPDR